MDDTLIKIKVKRYLTQFEYLELELEETEYLFKEYNRRFLKEYYNVEEEEKPKPKIIVPDIDGENEGTPLDIPDELIDKITDETTEDYIHIKKLYRLLSLKTHPDKNNGTKESKEEFAQINKAYKEKDILRLFKFAIKYKIKMTANIVEACVSLFDKTIKDMQGKIDNIKQTVAWNWGTASEEEKEMHREILKKANL